MLESAPDRHTNQIETESFKLTTMTQSIRIAIVGGGVAGASLLHALIKYSHLDVHIFESATEFKEAGMAFGLARNAQAALQLIGPSAMQCLQRAGAVPMKDVQFVIAKGEGGRDCS